jgi:CRP-like cAMP-binding protein
MAEPGDESKKGFVEGASIAPDELHARHGIPLPEIASFRDVLRVYSPHETIIQEGDQEQALYLLRAGTVEVTRGTGTSRESLGTIGAVNFFGEMSMINDEPRNATVVSGSGEVVVYRIPNPNIQTFLTNPLWAELLIMRLCRNLAASVKQRLADSEQLRELRAELERLRKGS